MDAGNTVEFVNKGRSCAAKATLSPLVHPHAYASLAFIQTTGFVLQKSGTRAESDMQTSAIV